jgi:hypothetical protein
MGLLIVNEKLSEKREDFFSVLLLIENLLEAEKIERFKFTQKEQSALLFVIDLLNIHLKELQRY